MIARYYVDFKCGDDVFHTTWETTFPTVEQYSAKEYSLKKASEVAKSFVDGYLHVKGLLGRVTPTDIRYTIEFH